jgi:hypothetical protein
MRKIDVVKWKARNSNEKGELIEGEHDESILFALNVLLSNKRPEEMPRGLEKFKLFKSLFESFAKAEKTGILELEESDYEFLKKSIETDVPASWGANVNIAKAIVAFLDVKKEA